MRRYGQMRRRGWKSWLAISSGLVICSVAFFAWSGRFQSAVLGDPNDVDQIKPRLADLRPGLRQMPWPGSRRGIRLRDRGDGRGGRPIAGQRNRRYVVVAPAHDATGLAWRHSDQTLFEIIKFGEDANVDGGNIKRMPAFKDKLSDDEIWMTIALIKSSWPPAILRTRDSNGVTGR